MLRHLGLTLCLACAGLVVIDVAWAQRGRSERRFDPTELLKRMDANGNGQLEPDEVSGRARGFVERAAERADLDPKQPLPIDKLSAAMQERFERRDDDDDDEEDDDNDDEKKEGDNASTSESPMTETPAAPAPMSEGTKSVIVGFGVEHDRTLPPGFGPPATEGEAKDSSGSGSRSSSSSRSRSGSSSQSEQSQKIRRYAEGLMKQYDKNNNGVLERDEWKEMRGDPEKADRNDDKIITLDELTDRLANYSRDGGNSSGRDRDRDRGDRRGDDRGRSRDRSESTDSERKSYRFLTPIERLPKGLPTWFLRNDANADGQVSMAEYSTSYNETTVAEFMKYDGDGDGIITPQECLVAEEDKTAKK